MEIDSASIITKLESFHNQYVGFIKLTTKDGSIGWGQCSTYNADISVQVFHRQIAPWALGKSANDLQAIITLIEDREHKYPGSYRNRALAGLDTAIWDWKGRKESKPVVSLLGGKPMALRAYASSMKRDITPEDEAKRFMKLRDEDGFTAFKWRVGAECGHDQDEWQGRTPAVIKIVSAALGAGIDKLVDANSCYSPQKAIEVGKSLIDHGIHHFEEPCPYWLFDQTKAVRDHFDQTDLDITGGEQDWDLAHWQTMMKDKVVDILQPDIMYLGGITRTLAVTKQADKLGFACTPHSANLSLVTICTMHLLGAIPNAGKYLEFSIEGADYYPWQENLFMEDCFNVKDGKVQIPSTPGWGVTINPKWLNQASYQISALD